MEETESRSNASARTARDSEDEPPSRHAGALYHLPRVAIGVALAVLTHQLFPASPATDVPVYEVGSVATSIVVAPFAFRVAKSPEEVAAERRAIANTTSPVFIFDSTAIDSAGVALDRFDLALREAAARPPGYAIPALQSAGSAHGV